SRLDADHAPCPGLARKRNAPRFASRFRHPSARRRRRSACHPRTPRPRLALDHAALHRSRPNAFAEGLRTRPPSCAVAFIESASPPRRKEDQRFTKTFFSARSAIQPIDRAYGATRILRGPLSFFAPL